jgi:hypothetical protein
MLDMAIRNEPEALRGGYTRIISCSVRSFIVILGAIGIWWGALVIPVFWEELSIERIAGQITAGEPFKSETLSRQLPIVQAAENSSYCRPSAVRSAALIRFGIVENIISSSNKNQLDENLNSLRSSIRISLSCSPADPILWLIYYWIQNTQIGHTSEQLKYLRMSYQLGQNEAWIGLVRNRFAFAIFEQLPPDLTKNAINEFIGLLETGRLYRQVAEIFTGPAWHVRNFILLRLSAVSDRQRDPFIYELRRLGYDVDLPGIDKRNRRPWQ